MLVWTLKKAKRLIITVIGFTIVAIGMAMIVLPGPAIIVIPIVGVLATEYVWAMRLLKHAKSHIARIHEIMASRQRKPEVHR